jgi:DNA-binding GntR family transcriptional regulator
MVEELAEGPMRKGYLGYATVAELVGRNIRGQILSGELAPGTRINLDELARQLNSSRMPVREALRRLEETGFVESYPHRGYFVVQFSIEHMLEVYMARLPLEVLVARRSAELMTEEVARELRGYLDAAESALRQGDYSEATQQNEFFHLRGYGMSGYKLICKLITDLRAHATRYRLMLAQLPDRPFKALSEDRELVAAWKRHDSALAESWTRINLRHSVEALESAFAARVDEERANE